MTKRAGKRKHRNGSQRHPPGPTQREPSVSMDEPLDDLELRALRDGWLHDDPSFEKLRKALMTKVMRIAMSTNDERMVLACFRALSTTEIRQQMVEISRQRANASELPDQEEGDGLPMLTLEGSSREIKPYEFIQDLVQKKEARLALSSRPSDSAGLGDSD